MSDVKMSGESREEKNARTARNHKRIYHPTVGVRFRRVPPDNDIYPAMIKASEDAAITWPEYCRIAVKEKLIADGYLEAQ